MKRLLSCLVLFLAAGLVLGQAETTGRISGRVMDDDGKPIEGALVSVQSPAMQGVRTFTTDANGRYVAALLPPGSYTVSVTAPDMDTKGFELKVGIGQNVPLDVTLKKGGLTETVVVTGDVSKLTTTAGGEDFSYDQQINELPIVARDFERVAELAPNISFGPTPNTLSIAGAPSFDTNVLVDGAEVSDPYFGSAPVLFIEDAMEEVQVLTSGVSARYGRFQGGVINATTKSGGNALDASARVDFAKQSWNDKTPFAEPQNDDLQKTYSATVGGPIMKDRLWFYVAGRTIPTSSTNNMTALSGESYATSTEEDRWQVKLTGAINADHIIEGSYSDYERLLADRAGLPAASLDALADREDPRETTTFEYQGILSDKLFVNLQGTQKRVSIMSGATDTTRSPFFDFYGASFQIWNNHWWDFDDASDRDNDTLSASLTQVLSTANWGDHTFEYGAQYVKSTTAGENKQSASGYNLLNYDAVVGGTPFSNVEDPLYDPMDPRFNLISYTDDGNGDTFPDGGVTYRWYALPLGGDQELENTALYIQDTWQKGKLRLDAGLRWESYDGKGPEPTLNMDFDEIAPRLGATYNLDNNWQLQATWGKYVSRFNDNVASSISGVGGAPYVVALYTGPTTCDDGDPLTPAPPCLTAAQVEAILRDDSNWDQLLVTITDPTQPTRYLASDATAPYAYDFNVAVKRALPKNAGTFTLTYTDRSYRDLLDDFVGGQGVSAVVDPISKESLDFDTTVWDNASNARRDYEALAATIEYRPGKRWNVGGNWTYAYNRGNYEGEGRNTPASGSIIGDYPNSVPQADAVPYGYVDEDIRHRIRSWGNYRWDFGRAGNLVLGAVGIYQSGRNYSKTASRPLGNDPTYLNEVGTTYTHFFDGRGNSRFNGFWALDFSSRYQIDLYKKLNLWMKVDVLNLTNNDELIAFNTSGSSALNAAGVRVFVPGASFGMARSAGDYQTPRSYFASVGLNW